MTTTIVLRLFGALLLACPALVRAQATVTFINSGASWVAPWYNLPTVDPTNNCAVFGANAAFVTEGNTLLAGAGYTAELWAGVAGGWEWEVQPLARTTFRTGADAGRLGMVSQVPIVFAVPTQHIIYQLRVWDNVGGTVTSWDAANNASAPRGATPIYESATLQPGPNTLEFRESFVLTPGFAATAPVIAVSRDGCKRYTGFLAGIPVPDVHQGENVTFSVVAPTPAGSVQWSLWGNNIPGATNTTFTRTNIQANQAGYYTAVVTATLGARTARMTNSMSINVLPAPRLTQLTMSPSKGFSAKVEGVTDRTVQIEYSSDFQTWTPGPIETIAYAWGCGCMHDTVTLPPPLSDGQRFYRIKLLP